MLKKCCELASALITTVFALGFCAGAGAATKEQCLAEPGFVWIGKGKAILGSDQRERDDAYRLTAEAIAAEGSNDVAGEERQLREAKWFDNEQSRREVAHGDICISGTLVTNAEYAAFVAAARHRVPGITEADYKAQGFLFHSYSEVVPFLWTGGTFPNGEGRYPVVLVSYDDARAFAAWKGKGRTVSFRLPTADEWEAGARGGDGRMFPWGTAWRADVSNTAAAGLKHTSAVGAFPAGRSPYGLDDVGGNVFEYTHSDEADPEFVEAKNCAWDDYPGFCRAAFRHSRTAASRHILIGFRLVME